MVWQWLNNNSGAINAIYTTVVAIITIFYAYQAYKQAKEAQKLRELQYTHIVFAGFNISSIDNTNIRILSQPVHIVFKNSSNTIAKNIELIIEPEIKSDFNDRTISKINISSLLPGQEYSYFIDYSNNHSDDEKYNFQIRYENVSNKEFNDSYYADL